MKSSKRHGNILLFLTFLTAGVYLLSGCKKLIDVGPPQTAVVSTELFSTTSGATVALLGVYANLEGIQNINTTKLPGLSADELVSYSAPISFYYTNSLNAAVSNDFWSVYYNYIYQANAVITKVTASTGIPSSTKQQLIAEATFLRAFFHFYLVNYFGDIPYATSTSYTINSKLSRLPAKDSVYPLIIKDMVASHDGLSTIYPSNDRTRANKAVATALLARIYLYTEDWTEAKNAAGELIDDPAYALESLDTVFHNTSRETIWQLGPDDGLPAAESYLSALAPPGITFYQVAISDFLFDAFEPGDRRQSVWTVNYSDGNITYHYPAKYKDSGDYSIVMRLGEQYLIRAEANAHLGDIPDAVADLDVLRNRAGLPPLPPNMTTPACFKAIQHERQTELFIEWGHRWFDLKRTGAIDTIMPAVCTAKGGVWNADWALYPIPLSQLISDPNMTYAQNPGY